MRKDAVGDASYARVRVLTAKVRITALSMLAVLTVVACGTSAAKNAGSVTVLAAWSGADQASFEAVLKPFTEKTGIKVDYQSTQDEAAILKTSIAAGKPPDLVATLTPQLLRQFAQQGKVVPLNGVVDMTALQSNYAKSWLDLGEPLNDGKLYEVFTSVSMKGLVWYDPKRFQGQSYNVPSSWQGLIDLENQIQASGTTPWCLGLHTGGADEGWPASDWLEEIVLGQSGPDVYDRWAAGTQKWSSPEITLAFETFGAILGSGDGEVYGGKSLALSASFKTAGDPLFTTPPKCYMYNQPSSVTGFFTADNPTVLPLTDFNFFALPDVAGQFAGAHVVSGDAFSMFHDTPQARRLIEYLTTSDAQVVWVKQGGKLSPNKLTPLTSYPDQISMEIAQVLGNSQIVRYDATDLMPAAMTYAARKALLDYVSNQNNLDKILAGLDKVQQTAYRAS